MYLQVILTHPSITIVLIISVMKVFGGESFQSEIKAVFPGKDKTALDLQERNRCSDSFLKHNTGECKIISLQ